MAEASKAQQLQKELVQQKSPRAAMAKVANRMLTDLEMRGTLRTGAEETNLAANTGVHDAAEDSHISKRRC